VYARDNRRVPRRALVLVLAATLVTLTAGLLLKLPCASGHWSDGRQYDRLCYSDVVALYSGRGLDRDQVPYLEAGNEYPVLTGMAMWVAAVPARSHGSFFGWTALLLGAAAVATAWALHRMAGRWALFFAVGPTLALYAFMNWDLLAVALATTGTLAYRRGRDGAAGVLLGLGAAAKLYPALLVVPFALGHLRHGRRREAIRLTAWSAGAWAAMNVPFALAAPERWSEFFRFSSARPADWDSLWLLAQRHLGFPESTAVVNVASAATFAGLAAVVWWVASRRPGFEAWTFAFPLLVLFLLAGKVYSPQFSLWLLPWFALALPDVRLFVAFSVADAAVFVTRFTWFGDFEAQPFPSPAFQLALVLRAVVLLACVVAWMRRPRGTAAPAAAPVEAVPA
jgi:uncharacterized membrane protein